MAWTRSPGPYGPYTHIDLPPKEPVYLSVAEEFGFVASSIIVFVGGFIAWSAFKMYNGENEFWFFEFVAYEEVIKDFHEMIFKLFELCVREIYK